MHDVYQMLQRQALWQKNRAGLSWPEKMQQAEVLREAYLKLHSNKAAKHQMPANVPRG